jgi:hypothetical protein
MDNNESRKQLVEQAKALGIKGYSRWSVATLREKIGEHKSLLKDEPKEVEAPKEAPRAKSPEAEHKSHVEEVQAKPKRKANAFIDYARKWQVDHSVSYKTALTECVPSWHKQKEGKAAA